MIRHSAPTVAICSRMFMASPLRPACGGVAAADAYSELVLFRARPCEPRGLARMHAYTLRRLRLSRQIYNGQTYKLNAGKIGCAKKFASQVFFQSSLKGWNLA